MTSGCKRSSAVAATCCWKKRSTASTPRSTRSIAAWTILPCVRRGRRWTAPGRRRATRRSASTRARSILTSAAATADGLRALEDQGDVGGQQCRRRLSGAGGARAYDRPAARHDLADPRSGPRWREISGSVYKKPFLITGPATGWVGETDARPQTASPNLDALSFPAMELYAMPAATATLLDDAAINLDDWIAAEVELVFAMQEGTAFVNGDGVNKPKGFLAYPVLANASWAWGSLGYIASGAAGAFAASNPSDNLIDLIYALKAGYRQNASFVMNRRTQATVRKFKDSTGNYLWQPPRPGRRPRQPDRFPAGGLRGHAGRGGQCAGAGVRRLSARLPDR